MKPCANGEGCAPPTWHLQYLEARASIFSHFPDRSYFDMRVTQGIRPERNNSQQVPLAVLLLAGTAARSALPAPIRGTACPFFPSLSGCGV